MDINAIKTTLTTRLEEKTKHLDKIKTSLRSSHSASFSEQAVERGSDDVKEQLEESIGAEIQLIKAALTRIEKGTYQVCMNCGGEIREKRLEALPYTSLCIACANGQGEQFL